ncbi:MAG: hypothetical protein WB683_20030, partial [Candidatus Sulfotelmatobacter sp.]
MIRNNTQLARASSRSTVKSAGSWVAVLVLVFLSGALLASPDMAQRDRTNQNWTNYVRIGAYGLGSDNAERIVQSAQEDGVFGIEVDNDIEGRYESFVDP